MRVAAFLCSIILVIAFSITRSECAIQPQPDRVVLLQVGNTGNDIDHTLQVLDKLHHNWPISLGVMSTAKNASEEWLSSTLYSGMRGLESSSPARYYLKIHNMALHPTPVLLKSAGIGWHVDRGTQLWGTSHNEVPIRFVAFTETSISDALALIGKLDASRDYVIVIFRLPDCDTVQLVATLGGKQQGLLTSPTSRCVGVVSDTDIRGSMLKQLGIQPERVAHCWSTVNTCYYASKTRCRRMLALCKVNHDLVIWVGVVASISCILLLFSCFTKSKPSHNIRKLRSVAAASIGMLPLASCEIGRWILCGFTRPALSGPIMLALCLVGGVVASELSGYRSWMALKSVMLFTLGYVVMTAIVGSEGVFGSVISSYLLSGIRLYGVGNEFMGILVGACLLTIRPHRPSNIVYVLLLVLALVFAVGQWGANFGGYAMCISAAVSIYMFSRSPQKTCMHMLLCLAAGLFVAVLFMPWPILIDAHMHVPTHMGEMALRASELGQNAITSVFTSKLHLFMNVLISPYGLMSVVGLIVILAISLKLVKHHPHKEIASCYLYWVQIGVLASVPAVLFNDSGIVPATIIMACVMIYALLYKTDGGEELGCAR